VLLHPPTGVSGPQYRKHDALPETIGDRVTAYALTRAGSKPPNPQPDLKNPRNPGIVNSHKGFRGASSAPVDTQPEES
jgi:hypothetical protein